MKIVWDKNPLNTRVELTDPEKEMFILKARLERIEDVVGMAALCLDEDGPMRAHFNPKLALSYLSSLEDNEDAEDYCKALFHELEKGSHCGDCTCVPSSCIKCHAEELAGVDTLNGLRKQTAMYVERAFGKDGERTIDDAIAVLADYSPKRLGAWLDRPVEEFEANVDGWKKQAVAAHAWLVDYRDTRLGVHAVE